MPVESSGIPKGTLDKHGQLLTYDKSQEKTVTADYSTAQTDTILISPTTDKEIEVHNVYASSDSSVIDVTIKAGSLVVFKLYTSAFGAAASPQMHLDCGINIPLTVTCGAGTFVALTYHEDDEA